MVNNEKRFIEIIEEAENDKNILGLFLGGARGKGFSTKYSDYDVYLIVKNGMKKKYEKKYPWKGDFDFPVMDLKEFKNLNEEWMRYSFAHIKSIIDKNGQIQKIIDLKSKIPEKKRKKYIEGYLGGYLNSTYRSLKCHRDGKRLAARMEANRSIEHLLKTFFCLHGGRSLPYYKHLEWDLEKWPLKKLPISSKELMKLIKGLMLKGDVKTISKMYLICNNVFRKAGYKDSLNEWKEDMKKEIGRW